MDEYRSSVLTCNVAKPFDSVTHFLKGSRQILDLLGTIERLDSQLANSEIQEVRLLKALSKLQRENKKLRGDVKNAKSIRTGD